jgi:hypothetical protein
MIDVVVKDPKQLEVLVAEHNRRISSAGQLATSRTLEVRRRAAEEERERLVAAIALGKGTSRKLVAEVEKREQEIEELRSRIEEAEASVQPLLLPRRVAVTDCISGSTSRFTGGFNHDRQLVERRIDTILVDPERSLVVQFREASLFEPLRFGRLPRLEPKAQGEGAGLDARRNAVRTELDALLCGRSTPKTEDR